MCRQTARLHVPSTPASPHHTTLRATRHATLGSTPSQVLRSAPKGIELMRKYPDISIDPGVTPWIDDATWKRDKVFSDILRWDYSHLQPVEAQQARKAWADLKGWHDAHPTADTVIIGTPAQVLFLELSQAPLVELGEGCASHARYYPAVVCKPVQPMQPCATHR